MPKNIRILFVSSSINHFNDSYIYKNVLVLKYDISSASYSSLLDLLSSAISNIPKNTTILSIGFMFHSKHNIIQLFDAAIPLRTNMYICDCTKNAETKCTEQNLYNINLYHDLNIFLNSIRCMINIINVDKQIIDLDIISCHTVPYTLSNYALDDNVPVLEKLGQLTKFNINASTTEIGKKYWTLDYGVTKVDLINRYFTNDILNSNILLPDPPNPTMTSSILGSMINAINKPRNKFTLFYLSIGYVPAADPIRHTKAAFKQAFYNMYKGDITREFIMRKYTDGERAYAASRAALAVTYAIFVEDLCKMLSIPFK